LPWSCPSHGGAKHKEVLESSLGVVERPAPCGIVIHMRSTNSTLVVGLAALLVLFAAGAAAALCHPGETSVACCIRKFPLSPIESCAATEVEALEVLNGLRMAYEAAKKAGGTADDFANNADLPEWKQECISNYVACKSEPDWTGPCYACLRRCEGQQRWPFAMCSPRPSKKG
jgi:hypothetical protein